MLWFYAIVFIVCTTVAFYRDSAPIIYTITQQQYTKIQIGWTRDQVTNLVGSSGNAITEDDTGNTAVIRVEYIKHLEPSMVLLVLDLLVENVTSKLPLGLNKKLI